jgi:hypothetical protein
MKTGITSYVGENGKLTKSTGYGNLFINVKEDVKYTITVDFAKMEYNVKESFVSMNISGTLNGFKFTPMNSLGFGKYQITHTAPAHQLSLGFLPDLTGCQFVADEDWAKGYIGENGILDKR